MTEDTNPVIAEPFTTEEVEIADGELVFSFTYHDGYNTAQLNISGAALDIFVALTKDELAKLITDADRVHARIRTVWPRPPAAGNRTKP